MPENKLFKGLISISISPLFITEAPLQLPFQLEIAAAKCSSKIASLNWFFHIAPLPGLPVHPYRLPSLAFYSGQDYV